MCPEGRSSKGMLQLLTNIFTGQAVSMPCRRIKLPNTNFPSVVSSLISSFMAQYVWSFWVVILMTPLVSFSMKWQQWWPNAALLKLKRWECRTQKCNAMTLISPELLFWESPPFLSSSRLSPSLWIPITVAVEGGLATRKHECCVNYSSDSSENNRAKHSKWYKQMEVSIP